MGRELQKRKRRSSRPATRQPSSNRAKLTNPLGNSIVARNWNKNETTTQNYRRLGLVSRLRAPTGGAEPRRRPSAASSSSSSKPTISASALGSTATTGGMDPFAIHGVQGTVTTEVKVERDAHGKITRVIGDGQNKRRRPNPLNDPLAELDTDSEAESAAEEEDAEEWGGFGDDDDDAAAAVVRQLESEANRPVEKRPRTASTREAEWLQALVDRHGDDVAAMARDAKLNPMQQTAADIARRLRKWKGAPK
ncbi:ribosome biogenesis protein Nop16 [Nemania sp. NC0429]|nr:ribosome biogenesis protein Nop16 [Nemania sp. NC0429]